ncbi:hypothetical protein B296_00026806, partial [Ensete ventricosum]
MGTVDYGQPAGAAVTYGHTPLERGVRKGLPPAASPTASKGGGVGHKGGRPLAGWLPMGKGSRCLRRGSSDNADGARG